MSEAAPQRECALREVLNGARWIARAGAASLMLPNDLPPWRVVYDQVQHWLKAGVLEALVHDLRELLRVAAGRKPQPTAAILDNRTLQSSPESSERAEYDGANGAGVARSMRQWTRWATCWPWC